MLRQTNNNFVVIMFCYILLIITMLDCTLGLPIMQPMDYLEKYGFYKSKASNMFAVNSKALSLDDSVKQFQKFAGLQQTGQFDTATKNKMTSPRCGMPDIQKPTNTFSAIPIYRWMKSNLTYNILTYTPDLTQQVVDDVIKDAFHQWEKVSALKFFTDTTGNADIKIKFETGQHGDTFPFDGRGSVLAHAFGPPNGDTHFDDDELFTVNSNSGGVGGVSGGIDLMWVAVHEFGHALGLQHSSVKGSIMHPFYPGSNAIVQLHQDDTSKIQNLYGMPGRPILIPHTTTTTTQRPQNCTDSFQTVICEAWKRAGYCKNNTRVKMICSKTCNVC